MSRPCNTERQDRRLICSIARARSSGRSDEEFFVHPGSASLRRPRPSLGIGTSQARDQRLASAATPRPHGVHRCTRRGEAERLRPRLDRLEHIGRSKGGAYGIRTRVTGVRGQRPRPLDECAPERVPEAMASGKLPARAGSRSSLANRWRGRDQQAEPDSKPMKIWMIFELGRNLSGVKSVKTAHPR